MLVCPGTSYMNHQSVGNAGGGKLGKSRPPRIISEIRKCSDSVRDQLIQFRPKICADLVVLLGADPRWQLRRVQVRAGQLLLSPVQGSFSLSKPNDLGIRIPLRHLSLQAGPLPNSLSLVRGKTILITLQTSSERHFDIWVKSIAIEIIRQTPLKDVKYLDVFTLATKEPTVPKHDPVPTSSAAGRHLPQPSASTATTIPNVTTSPIPNGNALIKPLIHFNECDVNKNIIKVNNSIVPGSSNYIDTVEVLLKKCQSSENYVPVKEKLVLFESLCRIGRGSSSEDVSNSRLSLVATSKRARSMHDLTYCFASGGVREICKYFETKCGDDGKASPSMHIKRMVHSDSSLNKVTFNRHFENVSYA